MDALTQAMRQELEKWYPALAQMRLETFSVTALDVAAHDTAAHVRVTVSFHADGHEPWTTAGVSSDLNQAALMAIVMGSTTGWRRTNSRISGARRNIKIQFRSDCRTSTTFRDFDCPGVGWVSAEGLVRILLQGKNDEL